MCQKHLLKAKKKTRLKAKKTDDNKKAGNDKNAGNDKDTGPLAFAIATFSGPPTPVTTFFSFLAPITAFPSPSTPGSVSLSSTSVTGASVAVCLSPFSFLVWPFLYSFPAYYTTPISFFLMQVLRSILLLLNDDYAV